MLPFEQKIQVSQTGTSNDLIIIKEAAPEANTFMLGDVPLRRERNFAKLELADPSSLDANPVLVIQSPKTPTLSRKLKAVSLDSDSSQKQDTLDIDRDVTSMPNTPKKQIKHHPPEFDESSQKSSLAPCFSSNLKRFASNTSISGSQTLKTLPEIMTLQDFSDTRTEPVRIKAKGLLERRGSNASLTIDLSATSDKPVPISRLNTAKSVSNLNLSYDKCECTKKCEDKKLTHIKEFDRRKSQTHLETCGNCTIYESIPSKSNVCKSKFRKCNCICNFKCDRKSLSNENLYVPPCSFCHIGTVRNCSSGLKHCKGHRRACYPRQADIDASQLLSEDFKMHLQNVQYLQTAGSVLSIEDLKSFSERVPKLHQEFWEVPLNLQEKCLVSGSQTRNRYRGVLPNEHSRVHLSDEQPYIHANYIKGPDYTETSYIATQGPMLHTCVDFWEMVWITKSNCIVMLTQLVEKGRNKCELYFPLGKPMNAKDKTYYSLKTTRVQDKFTFESMKSTKLYEEEIIKHEEVNDVTYGKYHVKFISKESLGDCMIRKFVLERSEGRTVESRKITHYWYPNWQDHKMAEPQQVLKIALHVQDFLDNNNNKLVTKVVKKKSRGFEGKRNAHSETRRCENSTFRQNIEHFRRMSGELEDKRNTRKVEEVHTKRPLIVHCSAGIGRTGCFLAILNGIQQLRSNFNVDVLAILCSLRLHRGGMVQTAEQYELIHRVLSLYAEKI